MNNSFYSYLDDFDIITIIIKKELYHPNTTYTLIGNDEIIPLEILEVVDIGNEEKIITTFDQYLDLEKTYTIETDTKMVSFLYTGKVVRTSLFDSIYYYRKDDLGVTYSKTITKFKIWSPVAKKIELELVDKDGNTKIQNLFYKGQGLWRAEVNKDVEGYKYRYIVHINGKQLICNDPYAISSTPNNEYNYIIDTDKLYKMQYKGIELKSSLDAIIYETSFRDFTSYLNDPDKSTYLKLIEPSLKNKNGSIICFDYLKDLGITHIQLMPFFLFGDVDESDRLKKYNWGYNPVSYNVPSGVYTVDSYDPYKRINDLKYTIDMIHKNGLNVVMDVVYNHVFDACEYPFEKLCPGYMYMYNSEGIRTNYSGCKNDVDSSKRMVRKYIIDSITYWAREYNIDGFRLDLMGLMDFETVNSIYQELKLLNPNIIMYGEGWKMIHTNKADTLSHMFNKNTVSNVGFFNDRFRNSIKDYAKGDVSNLTVVREILLGSVNNRYLFKYARQSINYVECHDNITLFDYIRFNNDISDIEAKKRALLATSITILSIGTPFIHSGQEFYRSKNFIDNTYNLNDDINSINWDLLDENVKDIEFIKELIKIRKKYQAFHLDTKTDIENRVRVDFTSIGTIILSITLDDDISLIYKTNPRNEDLSIDGYKVLLTNLDYSNNKVSGIGTMVLLKE